MKKFFACLLSLCFLIGMASCNNLPNGNGKNNSVTGTTENNSATGTTATNTCNHNWISATCTEPKTCSKCGKTSGLELGHTTTTGVCSRCGKNFGSWKIDEFVDEFKQPTGEKFVAAYVYGTFSNSATTNSKLYAGIQVTSNDIAIMLWEYGSQLVKGTFDTNKYDITVLDTMGKKHYFSGTMYKSGTRIYVSSSDKSELLALLKKSGTLKLYVAEDSKYSRSTYLFSIETDGFTSLYMQIN
ncbi:MAG: hypothetical protein ACI3XN_02100 [Eubacteriales bacterium]